MCNCVWGRMGGGGGRRLKNSPACEAQGDSGSSGLLARMLCSVHENRFSRTRHQMLTWGGWGGRTGTGSGSGTGSGTGTTGASLLLLSALVDEGGVGVEPGGHARLAGRAGDALLRVVVSAARW
jgi:hypothetical protein